MITDIPCGAPSFADDVALTAESKEALLLLLQCAYNYSLKWKFKFNCKKSAALIFGHSKDKKCTTLKLGNDSIEVKDSYNHVGITLNSNLTYNLQDRISKGRQCFNAMASLGIGPYGLHPSVHSKLYWAVCVPTMIYGAEVIDISDKDIEMLECTHRQCAKRIQRLPSSTSNPATIEMLGWWPIEAFIDMLKLMFVYRLLVLPASNIYRLVFVLRTLLLQGNHSNKIKHGPVASLIRCLQRYDLLHVVNTWIDSGDTISKFRWKKLVKAKINTAVKHKWITQIFLYPSLSLLQLVVENIQLSE